MMTLSGMGAAVALAERGLKVFRTVPGAKSPLRKGWQDEATTDVLRVIDLWSETPNANPAVSTSGLVVVDPDKKSGGLEAVAALGLPETFTVRTPGGGLHLYFLPPPGEAFATRAYHKDNTTGKEVFAIEGIAGVDVRAEGGLVVGPGSHFFDGGRYVGAYVIEKDLPIATLPPHAAERLQRRRERTAEPGAVIGELDTPAALARAIAYLEQWAPIATEGAAGDPTTITVANRVYDFGVSFDAALELMLTHWNDRNAPPWDAEALAVKVASALASRQDAVGRENPSVCLFEVSTSPLTLTPPPVAPSAAGFAAKMFKHPATEVEGDLIPPRPWLVKGLVARKQVTLVIAPGATGKSLLNQQIALALATGDGAPIGMDVVESVRVLMVNNEDPKDEIARRAEAAHREFKIDRAKTHHRIDYISGPETGIFKLVVKDGKRALVPGPGYVEFDQWLTENPGIIGAAFFDPFASLHMAVENDNSEIEVVAEAITVLAIRHNIAIIVAHHTNKPPQSSSESYAGNVNAARGASGLKDKARIAVTLFTMSEKDAEAFGIPAKERHRYVRLDDAKNNTTLSDGEPRWFRKVTQTFRNGEAVGVLRPEDLTPKDVTEHDQVRKVLAAKIASEAPLPEAARLVESDPMFHGRHEKTLTKLIKEALKHGPVNVDGRSLSFDDNGTKTSGVVFCVG